VIYRNHRRTARLVERDNPGSLPDTLDAHGYGRRSRVF